MEEISLIQDLMLILVGAGGIALIFSLINTPVILGYILVGLLMGPYLTPTLWIKNPDTINAISELGIIFLMFYIGLEFDLRKLKQTFTSSLVAVFLQTLFAFILGTLFAPLLGWTAKSGFFFGGVLAISSTMIAMPILSHSNASKRGYAQFTLGMLIFEDILAILLLVILTGLGQSGNFEWSAALHMIFAIGAFVVTVLLLGRLSAPKLLKTLEKYASSEVFNVVLVGIIFFVGQIGHSFSIALGSFLAGAIFSSTDFSDRVEKIITPFRDIFSAIFFVSIGMLINPYILFEYKWTIMFLTLLIVAGKIFTVWLGFFMCGQRGALGFKAAIPKAQIGEFSFIIAALGQKLGVTDERLMPISVGISILSIMFVNVLHKNNTKIYKGIDSKLPKVLRAWGGFYQNFLTSLREYKEKNGIWKFIKKPLLQITLYFLLINAIVWLTAFVCNKCYDYKLPYLNWLQRGLWFLALLIALPFFIGTVRKLNATFMILCEAALKKTFGKLLKHEALYNVFRLLIMGVAVLVFAALFIFGASPFLPSYIPMLTYLVLGLILTAFFWKDFNKINTHIELMFLNSFKNALELENEKRSKVLLKTLSSKKHWGIKTKLLKIAKNSYAIGKRIRELDLRNLAGVTIVGLSRQNFYFYEPHPDFPVFPGDNLIVLGTVEQINRAENILSEESKAAHKHLENKDSAFDLGQILVDRTSFLANETLISLDLRNKYGVNVVGILRDNALLQTPKPEDIIMPRDMLLVVGTKRTINKFKNALEG